MSTLSAPGISGTPVGTRRRVARARTAAGVQRGPWFLLRLVRWELYLIWRRPSTRVLLALLLGGYALIVGGIALLRLTSGANGTGAAGLIQAELTFPNSLALAAAYTGAAGLLVLCFAAALLVGGEYAGGTQRVTFSRGAGRGEVLAAQVIALAIAALALVTAMLALGALLGLTLGPALGGSPTAITAGGWRGGLQVLGLDGALALRLFVYSLIALFFATLGRSAAAGVGGALGFIAAELILLPVLTFIAFLVLPQRVGNLVRFVFPQVNADAVQTAAQAGPLNLAGPPPIVKFLLPTPGALQALAALLLYAVVLVAISYVLLRRRDVTD